MVLLALLAMLPLQLPQALYRPQLQRLVPHRALHRVPHLDSHWSPRGKGLRRLHLRCGDGDRVLLLPHPLLLLLRSGDRLALLPRFQAPLLFLQGR